MKCTKTRGKKGERHDEPHDPPRRRANKKRGHGDYAGDRPAVFGAVSRQTGEVHLRVVKDSSAESLLPAALEETAPGTRVVTDEWRAYSKLSEEGRPHATVNHGRREWARDDDGDGVREVHSNTMEGLWTSLRNWLRPFRGVSKKYLQGYVAAFEWGYNRKRVDKEELWKIVSRVVDKELFSYVPG
jgi:transposase-like protein